MNAWPQKAQAEICTGRVYHQRLKPFSHAFSYAVFFLRVPLSQLDTVRNRWCGLNRFNLMSFMLRDYGPRDGSNLETWARTLLQEHGVTGADGEIVLQTFPRLLGYVFNPISVWYCFDRAGALRAAICEVNNTFGERHNYLVAHTDQRAIERGNELVAKKVFHVSPFCEVNGQYRFRFEQTGARAFAQVDYFDAEKSPLENAGKLLVTTITGTPAPLNSSSAFSAFIRHPLMTIGVVARIHWQAFALWRKRLPIISKPAPPILETTR